MGQAGSLPADATSAKRFYARINARPQQTPASFLASRIWKAYRLQGGKRNRILSDFLIGAHAQLHTSTLLSRDRGFYREMFPSLSLFDPGPNS